MASFFEFGTYDSLLARLEQLLYDDVWRDTRTRDAILGSPDFSYRTAGTECQFDRAIEIDIEVDVACFAVHLGQDSGQIGGGVLCSPTQGTQDVPRHVEQPEPGREKKRVQDGAAWQGPLIGEGIGPHLDEVEVGTFDHGSPQCFGHIGIGAGVGHRTRKTVSVPVLDDGPLQSTRRIE